MAKCKNCNNLIGKYIPHQKKSMDWCDYITDSPDTELDRECDFFKPETNADRIRNMTDEELAEFWENKCDKVIDCKFCEEPINEYGSCTGQCRNEFLRWLQKEVE